MGGRTKLIFLALMPVFVAQAQNGRMQERIYPERLSADLEVIRACIHEVHPDPYRYTTRAGVDRLVDSVRTTINEPMLAKEFLASVLPVFHAVGDARFHPSLPAGPQDELDQLTPMIPLQFRILQDGLYVEEEPKGFRSIPIGSRVMAINGRPVPEVLELLGSMVVCDGANTTYRDRVIERDLPRLLHLHIDQGPAYTVQYQDLKGRTSEATIFAMTGEEMSRTRKPEGKQLMPWRYTDEPATSTCWLTLSTLDEKELAAAGQRPEKYLAALLKEVERSGTRTLVIDVRGAGGQELGMAELVFATIAREPFRVVQDMTVRSIAPPALDVPVQYDPEHYTYVATHFVPGGHGHNVLRADDHRLDLLPPAPKGFAGKVYVVCDGSTRDAAAALVMMARRTGRARVVGEEVGTNAFSFTGGRMMQVTLPNSGLQVQVPLIRYVPEGMPTGPLDHGEQPRHPVEQLPSGLAKGRDTVREALLEMIRELR